MPRTVRRGLAAGAAGVTALNAATYLDMALTGRPASSTPEQAVERSLGRLGLQVAGGRATREHRLSAFGALGGITTGLAVGVGASLARRAGVRLPAPVGALATGVAAAAAGNLPLVRLGLTDPRTWSETDWVRDVVPHLAFGVAVRGVLDATERPDELPPGRPQRAGASRSLVYRSTVLGFATGCRSSLGLAAPLLARRSGRRRLTAAATAAIVAGELVADKLPTTPSRLEVPALSVRYGSGSVGAVLLARREGAAPLLPALAAVVGTTAGVAGGALWREYAEQRGWAAQSALVEDGVALVLAAVASRR